MADLRAIESMLDQQETESAQTMPTEIGKYQKSHLKGWSPKLQPKKDEVDLDKFSLVDSEANPEDKPNEYPKKPKMSKQERRELQERQRSEKAAQQGAQQKHQQLSSTQQQKQQQPSQQKQQTLQAHILQQKQQQIQSSNQQLPQQSQQPQSQQHAEDKNEVKGRKQQIAVTADNNLIQFFSHLPKYLGREELSYRIANSKFEIHPAIIELGLRYANGSIRGGNARCTAMLYAFKQVIHDYQSQQQALKFDLDKKLRPMIQYLIDCRPHSISMGNAIKYVKNEIGRLDTELDDDDAKTKLCDSIDSFIQERIICASQLILQNALPKIVDGDVILTYGRSYLIEKLLLLAKEVNKKFRVIIIDSRPLLEGRQLAQRLSQSGISCTYALMHGISFLMKEVTKVLLGASALFSNGTVLSRVGTAPVAMMARFHNIPVLVCCETYKFSEKVQLDSICNNELSETKDTDLVTNNNNFNIQSNTEESKQLERLKKLSLRYDITPMKYVRMVITEAGAIPPTSVPVLVREYRKFDSSLT